MKVKKRIHIAPVGFEVDRIVMPAIQLQADKVYLLVYNNKSEDKAGEYIARVIKELKAEKIETEKVFVNWRDVESITKEARRLFLSLSGNDIYVNIANWPRVRDLHWTTLLKARAIENQAYMIGVNRIGQDNNETYLGNSIVYGPDGGLVISCADGQKIFFCTIEKNKVRKTRDLFPIITDRKLLIGG